MARFRCAARGPTLESAALPEAALCSVFEAFFDVSRSNRAACIVEILSGRKTCRLAAVDVKIRGKSFRFISTHLDAICLPFTSAIQQAQAAELLGGPAATDLPVLLVGDLNSPDDGTGATYNNLIGAGFADAAVEAGLRSSPTCCQAPNLLNAVSILNRRIDYVLSRPEFKVLGADIVGEEPGDRTVSGLWPSDHAGVVATVELPHP